MSAVLTTEQLEALANMISLGERHERLLRRNRAPEAADHVAAEIKIAREALAALGA